MIVACNFDIYNLVFQEKYVILWNDTVIVVCTFDVYSLVFQEKMIYYHVPHLGMSYACVMWKSYNLHKAHIFFFCHLHVAFL